MSLVRAQLPEPNKDRPEMGGFCLSLYKLHIILDLALLLKLFGASMYIRYIKHNERKGMKKVTNALAGVAITVVTVMAFSVPAFALTGANAAAKTAAQAARCTVLTAKIDEHIAKINAAFAKQVAMYEKHDAKVDALIAKAKTAGADTTKAEADLQTWEDQTVAIKNARTQVVTELSTIKNLQCVDQKDQYKQGLTSAKTELLNIRTMQINKKSFFINTVKPDLQALRDQLKQQ